MLFTMSKGNSSKDSTQQAHTSSKATAGESSHRPRGKVGRFLGKDNVNLRISRSKDSCNRSPVPPNVNHERAKIILAQADHDATVLKLLEKLSEVYSFITQDEMLGQISSMRAILGYISQQTRECAHLIKNYLETSNFCECYKLLCSVPSQASAIITGKRLGKNAVSETTDTIQKYSDVYDRLMQNFRDQVAHDVAIHIHDIGTHVHDITIHVHRMEEILNLSGMTYAPDGTCIITGSWDKTVRLWDAATGQLVSEPLREHTDSVESVSFSPDARIVPGLDDKTVRLQDAAMGQPVGEPLRGHTDTVNSASFSPDSTRIITGPQDSTVRRWDAVMRQPSPQRTESDHSAFPDEHPIMYPIESATTMTWNTWNNHFFSFSSNSIHALRNTSELTEGASHDDRSSTHFLLNHDSGWMVGPKHRLLFWVLPAPRHPFYSPQTALMIPRGPELYLSRIAHGQHWQKC
ncbi:WD40 repeat-like protein [Suillus weaverae]|nr:WD40 repeat-like protein [Suillus weaverae]